MAYRSALTYQDIKTTFVSKFFGLGGIGKKDSTSSDHAAQQDPTKSSYGNQAAPALELATLLANQAYLGVVLQIDAWDLDIDEAGLPNHELLQAIPLYLLEMAPPTHQLYMAFQEQERVLSVVELPRDGCSSSFLPHARHSNSSIHQDRLFVRMWRHSG
ncbi:uncharacterized protein LOC120106621 [Phoenix dactylifera]|uniref:Uncharacterized protein LOC120106621 n=1 Tax=Phoenix dactylifera TaxID=42345 RepID=A0A8B8ZQB4_PHODC|nr:uncharacterized protein LOC120106621 [Phoenix dactylifera]